MTIPENKIEDILYECPWLLNPTFEIANIAGTKGFGRQVILKSDFETKKYKKIDLLMTDTIDQRPIIVELKNRELKKGDVGQILEYRAKCTTLDEERKIEWNKEFGMKYLAPKLILVVESVSPDLLIATSIAGVEVRVFESIAKELELTPIGEYIKGLKEWKEYFKKGDVPIHQRALWVESIRQECKISFYRYSN